MVFLQIWDSFWKGCVTPQIHVSSSNTHPPQGSPTAYMFLYQDLEYQEHDLFISYAVKQTVIDVCPLLYDFQPPYQGAIHIWCQNCQLPAIADCQLAWTCKRWHGMHSISCRRGLVYIRQTGGSIGNKVKEHHHLDIPAVAVITSNSKKTSILSRNLIMKDTYRAVTQ